MEGVRSAVGGRTASLMAVRIGLIDWACVIPEGKKRMDVSCVIAGLLTMVLD